VTRFGEGSEVKAEHVIPCTRHMSRDREAGYSLAFLACLYFYNGVCLSCLGVLLTSMLR
jgi:hypothetical protein